MDFLKILIEEEFQEIISAVIFYGKIPYVQLKLDQTERLLNKPYVNEVHLIGQNLT